MGHSLISRCRLGLGILVAGSLCAGCMGGDLGTSVAHKPHTVADTKKGGAADMDLLPAPPGWKTGTPK